MIIQVKERPILFSGAMVRALLDGSKTQTRREVKMPPSWDCFVCADWGNGWWPYRSDDGESPTYDNNEIPLNCPYGRPGDRLWARETWAPHPDFTAASRYAVYRADPECEYDVDRWRPSIHMPRWASRILLEITRVSVERLQDIGVEEIEAEGVVTSDADIIQHGCRARVMDWQRLWDGINGAGSWDANPWVWVVEFKRVVP